MGCNVRHTCRADVRKDIRIPDNVGLDGVITSRRHIAMLDVAKSDLWSLSIPSRVGGGGWGNRQSKETRLGELKGMVAQGEAAPRGEGVVRRGNQYS